MKLRLFSCLLVFMFIMQFNAQTPVETPLMVVDNTPVYKADFIRVYNKNIDLVKDESQKNVDEYLKLFIDYKLKIKEAQALGYHKNPNYIKELASHKKQLSKKFITDSKVTDDLVKEAYQRISQDVKASHILVRLDESANPQDTLKAYNEITKLRNRALKEGFEAVRNNVHNGTTVFGEELGYFTGFRMVYKFENVAYNTPVGQVSMPFRTQFGYHIINVLDKRQSRGEVTVAHIMVVDKEEATNNEASKTRVNEIYKKIQQGEDFAALAKQFSDDKSSASSGGEMKPFTGGQINSEVFENTAFGLKNIGDISAPIETNYGWHIIKLLNRKLTPPLSEIKSELENKVKRDSRSQLINSALINKLRKKYNVKTDSKNTAYFQSILTEDYYSGNWSLPKDFPNSKMLFNLEDKKFMYSDFGTYLKKYQNQLLAKLPFNAIVNTVYTKFLNEQLVQYQEDNLEKENPDYAHVIEEYRDGLLLFELMNKTIWSTTKNDSIAIKEYYKLNKAQYVWPKRIDALVASSSKKNVLKKVSKLLKTNTSVELIKADINKNNEVDVIFTTGVMDKNHQSLPKTLKFKTGVSKIFKHNDTYVLVNVKEVIPVQPKSLEEAKGQLTSDYQAHKEKLWLNSLRDKYKVTVNQSVLKQVKNTLKHN